MSSEFPDHLVTKLKHSLRQADRFLETFIQSSDNNYINGIVSVVTDDASADLVGVSKLTRKVLALGIQIEFWKQFNQNVYDFYREYLIEKNILLARWNASEAFFNWYTESGEEAISNSLLGLFLEYSDPRIWPSDLVSNFSQSRIQKSIKNSILLECPEICAYAHRRETGRRFKVPFTRFKRDLRGTNWLRMAAELGNAIASREFAHRYDAGDGMPQDKEMAATLYAAGAKGGDAESQHMLAYYKSKGIGCKRNTEEAVLLYRDAASRGHINSMYNLAIHLRMGDGAPTDLNESFRLLQESAEAGHCSAEADLGLYYSQGLGVETDKLKAVEIFKKCAARGNPYAQYNLGLAYLDGEGVDQDLVEAYKWFQICVSNNRSDGILNKCRELRNDVAERLTGPQIQEAKDRANAEFRTRVS